MKVTFVKEITQSVDVQYLYVSAGVRRWEDAIVNEIEDQSGNLIPSRRGDRWEPIIEIEKGIILNWPLGTTADIHYKICDDGVYTLKDIDGNIVAEIKGYVPGIMCPSESGFGDYIIMKIDATGKIEDWEILLADFLNEKEE